MRKGTILLATILAVGVATSADAAKKKAPAPDPAIAAQENSLKFIGASVHPWTITHAAPAQPKARKAKAKKKM